MARGRLLIGREAELAALAQRLTETRLLTLTGVGGCGKSSVAIEMVSRARRGALALDGQVVELASVLRPGRVVDAVLRALGAREHGGRSQLQTVIDALAGRDTLVLLDNCEHLLAEVGTVAARCSMRFPGCGW